MSMRGMGYGMGDRCVKGFDKASNVEKDNMQVHLRKEGETMKYKTVKPITLQGIYEAGNKNSFTFREVFNDLLRWCFFKWGMTTQFFAVINFDVLGPELEKRPKWRDFLFGGGFVEKVEGSFYSVGDHFRHSGGNEYMIAYVGNYMVQLIKTDGMFFYGGSIKVGDVRRITKKEFVEIVVGNEGFFTKMEEGK